MQNTNTDFHQTPIKPMKHIASKSFHTTSLLASAGLLLATAASQAAVYHISIDTTALSLPANLGSAPYAVDLQLNAGDTLNNNTAVVSNFAFGGGAGAIGAASGFGGVSGSIASGITLTDSSQFNEFYQAFGPGSTLSFDLSLTQVVGAGLTPESFSIAILDGTLANIPTTGLGDTLLQTNIDTTNGLTLNQGSGTGNFAGLNVTAVPEPTATVFALLACGAGVLRRRRLA